jgi:glyoxylase-like metal-dependent hydrolase (beta-lactamase superfamily II)
VPVDAARVMQAPEGFELNMAGRVLKFIDTAGHARHHFSVYDELSGGFFSGDTFGVSYRETDSARGAYIMPTTTPVQFDPQAWHASLDRYLAFRPQRMFLTHFGMVEGVDVLASHLHRALDDYVAIALRFRDDDAPFAKMKSALLQYELDGLRTHHCPLPEPALRGLLEMDVDLNAQGLEVWLRSQARVRLP